MSNRERLQLKNEEIQEMINLANSLPDYEDLNPELTTQDDLIEQFAKGLIKKSGGSENGQVPLIEFQQSNINFLVRDICYGDGVWNINTQNGIYYSEDGINWTLSNVTEDCYQIFYNNGIKLSKAFSSNKIYKSEDGKNWSILDITLFNDDMSHLVDETWSIRSSLNSFYISIDNATTWLQNNTGRISRIICQNGYIFYYDHNDKNLYCSVDGGLTFITCNINLDTSNVWYPASLDIYLMPVESDEEKSFFIMHVGGNDAMDDYDLGLYRSEDGINWIQVSTGAGYLWNSSCGVYANGIYVINGRGDCIYSIDNGITWNVNNYPHAYTGIGDCQRVRYINSMWFIHTYSFEFGEGVGLWYSIDGIDWHEAIVEDIADVAYNNGIYLATNRDSTYMSTDGISWTLLATFGGSKILYENGFWIISGQNGVYYFDSRIQEV